jgi:hypothetical protein
MKGSIMTHVSCSSCRLRFARALAAHLAECPLCGSLLDRTTDAEQTLGCWLFDADSSEPQGAGHGSPIVAGTTASAPRPLAQAISVALDP